MKELQDKIKNEGYIIDNRIIKVDHFINHMLDTELVFKIGEEFAKLFPNATKILTLEASGIPYALATAYALNNIPIVFARKSESLITSKESYYADVYSYTKQKTSTIQVNNKYLTSDDTVLIIDDFLAMGNASLGLIDICNQANAFILGVGIVIEKGFQPGRSKIEELGIRVESLANIIEIKDNQPIFKNGTSINK